MKHCKRRVGFKKILELAGITENPGKTVESYVDNKNRLKNAYQRLFNFCHFCPNYCSYPDTHIVPKIDELLNTLHPEFCGMDHYSVDLNFNSYEYMDVQQAHRCELHRLPLLINSNHEAVKAVVRNRLKLASPTHTSGTQ